MNPHSNESSSSRFQLSHLRPLPEEIARMSEDETACQYCGISYLLLTKYEKMEQKMKETEAELIKLKEYVEERPSLLAKIDLLAKARMIAESDTQKAQQSLYHWQQQAHETQIKLDQVSSQYTQMSKKMESQEKERRAMVNRQSAYAHQMIRTTHSSQYEVLQMRNELSKLKGSVQSYLKISFPTMLKRISAELTDEIERARSQSADKVKSETERKNQGSIDSLQKKIMSLNQSLQDANEINDRLSAELRASKDDFSSHVSGQKSYIQGLQSANLALEDRILQSNRQVMELSSEKESLHRQVKTLSEECQSIESRRQTEFERLERENLDLKTELSRKESTYQQLTQELRTKLEEKASSKNDAEQVSSDLRQAHLALSQKDKQMVQMENTIRELNSLLSDMRLERVKTIEAHQSRIKQLQERFLEDLKEASNSSSSDREQELIGRLEQQKQTELAQLREDLKKEIALIHSKNDSMVKELQSIVERQNRSKRQLQQSQKEMKQHAEDLASHLEHSQTELGRSRDQITALSKELAIARSLPKPGEEAEMTINQLRATVGKKDAEIKFLKETVRLECEERMGLVASLTALKRDAIIQQHDLQNQDRISKDSQKNADFRKSEPQKEVDKAPRCSVEPLDSTKPSSRPSSAAMSSGRISRSKHTGLSGAASLPFIVPPNASPEMRFELLMQAANARKEKKIAARSNRPIK